MQSNGLNRKEALTRMNMQLAAEKLQLGISDDNIGLQSPCRLTFNPVSAPVWTTLIGPIWTYEDDSSLAHLDGWTYEDDPSEDDPS
ncbi:hypothetical protein GNI_089680 [Gregarina niphandrodes]|uniref:Uncharacterized protein n=1 Tax=Gregarina niphandrodes TaxID=110365 RepID=A0A023B5R1_GRENI|nr:hypothetical protein GNI_089680 [Gregarina niphandrodes]EZG61007.1 hypothetical protein GNI_089680 [Gregarina niphandrodes]|eukprot:XP_011130809.1 hypothetical protein GNI_089680 [Gregarina niphandrodes]